MPVMQNLPTVPCHTISNLYCHYLATLRTIAIPIILILQVINSHYNNLKAITIAIALREHKLGIHLQK